MVRRIEIPITAYFHINNGILRVIDVKIVEGIGVSLIEEINSGNEDNLINLLTRVILFVKLLTVIIKTVELGKKVLRLRNRRNRYILIYRIGEYCLNRTFTNISKIF